MEELEAGPQVQVKDCSPPLPQSSQPLFFLPSG